MFKTLNRDWKGSATLTQCISKGGREIERIEEYDVTLVVEQDNEAIVFNFDMHSAVLKKSRRNQIKLYLEKNFLNFNDGPFNYAANVMYARNNFIAFMRKSRVQGKGNIPLEFVSTLAIYPEGKFMFEELGYTNGVLSSKTTYQLK